MKTICLYFQVHQPFRLRRYRFFEIGNNHYYYDDYTNESIMRRIAENCYLPTNKLLLDLINKYDGKFKVSFSITGLAYDQFALYAPDVLDSFKALAQTNNVEFLAESYAHSLASLQNKDEFIEQVKKHADQTEKLFGKKPTVFRNTELVYSDEIGEMIAEMDFKAILTEGAKHVLGWKSPNYLYQNAINPKLKVLLKNYKLSDDIAFRFSNQTWDEWPLTTEKFAQWINETDDKEELINLFMDYETFGEHQKKETGIFEFLKALPNTILNNTKFQFETPSFIANNHQPIAAVHIPNPISWADEERDLTAWLGNDLQDEAFNKLYDLRDLVLKAKQTEIQKDWEYLQASDHFYYMCTKFFFDGDVHSYFNPYETPYDAFVNYMNILSDFQLRINRILSKDETQIAKLKTKIEKKDRLLLKYKSEISKLKVKIDNYKIEKSKNENTTKATITTKKTKPLNKQKLSKTKTTRQIKPTK